MNDKYQLVDSISVYEDADKRLSIVLGQHGKHIQVNNTKEIVDLLLYLQSPRSEEEIIQHFAVLNPESVRQTLHKLLTIGVIETINSFYRKVICLIIGCGSLGSHIYRQLSVLPLTKIILIDNDYVDKTNLYRQDYYLADLNKPKVNVLANRNTGIVETIPLVQCISSTSDLTDLISQYNINLVIQAADYPTTSCLAFLINNACDKCNIPYIINSGYMGNTVSLPEFFYPNCEYEYSSSHISIVGKRIIQFQKSKLSYRLCSEVSNLISQQVSDYQHGLVPTKYGEKGYFDIGDFTWHTKVFINRPNTEIL